VKRSVGDDLSVRLIGKNERERTGEAEREDIRRDCGASEARCSRHVDTKAEQGRKETTVGGAALRELQK